MVKNETNKQRENFKIGGTIMKAITLWQPYASLIALRFKTIETRTWNISYRGELVIHASKKIIPFDNLFQDLNETQRLVIMHTIKSMYGDYNNMPVGAIIAKCKLISTVRTENIRDRLNTIEKACGDYTDGRYAWLLSDITPLEKPVSVKGKQGLWNWEVSQNAQ